MDTLGWRAIGYHFGIELLNDQYEIFLGRLPHEKGAHCKAAGMNDHSIGVCLVGEFDSKPVPQQQLEKCISLTRYLMYAYKIKRENVIGHREVEPKKSCPGWKLDLDEFRKRLVDIPDDDKCFVSHV
jgi:N-acetylmuramoyl-L-alanine amidase